MSGINEHTGYDMEDAAFKEVEQRQLKELRAKLDGQRASTAQTAAKEAHWMRCPKCGGQMAEQALEGVMIDKCTVCGGIYFDAGEVELLLKADRGHAGILGKLFGR